MLKLGHGNQGHGNQEGRVLKLGHGNQSRHGSVAAAAAEFSAAKLGCSFLFLFIFGFFHKERKTRFEPNTCYSFLFLKEKINGKG